jgi:hypothetical protein
MYVYVFFCTYIQDKSVTMLSVCAQKYIQIQTCRFPDGPGPDRTRPDTTSRSRTPLHRAGPPASATGHHPYQTYRPSQGRTQKPIVVVLDSTRRWNSRTSPTSSPALRARTRSTTSSTSHATSQFVSQPPGANRLLATAPAVCT